MHKQTTTARATRTPPNKKVNKLTMAVHVRYLSNRAQVSMLINHAGCWKNTRRIRKSRAAGE